MITIIQADRDAAADYHANGGWGDGREDWLANVLDTHPLIQAFARHREAAEQAERKAAVEWLREIPNNGTYLRGMAVSVRYACADAIATGKHL